MNILKRARNRFLKIFGDIKVYKWPFFLIYDPSGYKVKGDEIRDIIGNVQKGDIFVRGYANYLDGHFIKGFFSHTGLYLGKTEASDLDNTEVDDSNFYEGEQVMMHAMAEGVFMEDVINFCRCDYLVILRRNTSTEPDYDPDVSFQPAYEKALTFLGKAYDFGFDFLNNDTVSCTEFVYESYKDILAQYKVKIKEHSFILFKKKLITPDDFITKEFDIIFKSRSVDQGVLNKILENNCDDRFDLTPKFISIDKLFEENAIFNRKKKRQKSVEKRIKSFEK